MDSLFPPTLATPSAGSLAARELRKELHGHEYEKLRIVLGELEATLLHRCRHASISLCGKLLESGLKFKLNKILSAHEFEKIKNLGLGGLSRSLVRLKTNNEVDIEIRTEIQRLDELGTIALLDIIRGYRNGVVHWNDAEIPTENMAEAIALFSLDIVRVFHLGGSVTNPFEPAN